MTSSPILGLPFIASQQSQPEVTHNTALLMLQALQLGAEGQQDSPPGSPTDGQVYVVGAAPTGAWSGRANCVAIWLGGWFFVPGFNSSGSPIAIGAAHEGLRVWRKDLVALTVWDGAAWEVYPPLES